MHASATFGALLRLVIAVVLFATGTTQAQAAYPERPIRIVVPVAAGGGNFTVAPWDWRH